MTLKSQQKKARELYEKGFKADDIADLLKVSHRSVQRWVSKDRNCVSDPGLPTPIAIDNSVTTSAIEKESRQSLQQKAIEMFESGLEPSAIAEELRAPIRTVLRWLQTSSSEETQNLISSLPLELQPAFVRNVPDDSSWVQQVEQTLFEHWETHRRARLKLDQILQTLLSASDLNCRAIHAISQALNRHTDSERKALNIEFLDLNRAVALLQAHRLGVVDFSQLEALKRQQLKPE